QDQPLWWMALKCCIYLENGDTLIHEFSDKHEDYKFAETKEKFDEVCKVKEEKDLGYPRCQTICNHGSTQCKACPHLALNKSPLPLALRQASNVGVKLKDFYAYMPMHNYIFAPSREHWPAESINARIRPIVVGRGKGKDGKEKPITIK